MKCHLDERKADKLRGVINGCSYAFKYDLDKYCKLCTIMDRYQDTVEYLNGVDLPCKEDQFNATDFIMWVNYADLIIDCLKELNEEFVVPEGTTFFHKDDIKLNSKLKGKTKKYFPCGQCNDDEYFRFIRAIVLAHAIKIDAHKQFTNGLVAYSPLVRWESAHDAVEITYYVADYDCKTQKIIVNIKGMIDYLESRCKYLDYMFDFIERANQRQKDIVKKKYDEDFVNLPKGRTDKINRIIQVHIKNGDIDTKNGASSVLLRLKQVCDCLSYQFNSVNAQQIIVFGEVVDYTLDDLVEYLREQKDDFLLNELFLACGYENKASLFRGNIYEINKIVSEYCDNEQTNWFLFDELIEKIKESVSKYVIIKERMSNLERAFLCMIAMTFDSILTDEKIRGTFPQNITKKVEQMYEV